MKMHDMNESERPREKLLERGAEALSDGELLAILLRTGRPGESALDLSHRLLSLVGGKLSGLYECSPDYLCALDGMGPARGTALLAAFEIGRRFMQERGRDSPAIEGASQVFSLMQPRLKGLLREECWLMLLDSKMRMLKTAKLTVGSGKATVFDIPATVRIALENKAFGIIVVHNHPSGDPRPSRLDIRQTHSLRDACTACGLSLLDHIIVADEHFYSFSEEKMY